MTDYQLTLEKNSSYCAGDPLPDGSVGDYLREFEEESFSFKSDESQAGGDGCESEDARIEGMLLGAYNLPSTASPSSMPAEGDAVLHLDPDLNSKLIS